MQNDMRKGGTARTDETIKQISSQYIEKKNAMDRIYHEWKEGLYAKKKKKILLQENMQS